MLGGVIPVPGAAPSLLHWRLSNFCAMLRCSQEKLHQELCRVLALSGFRVSALGLLPPLPSHASPQNLRLCLQKPSPLCAGRKWRLSLKGALRCDTNLFSTFPRLSFGTSLFWHRVLLPRWLCCGSEGKC